jgi:hypothetical protein
VSEESKKQPEKREGKPAKVELGKSQRNPELLNKTVHFPQYNVGDCSQVNATLIFESDGSGVFSCSTWTNHTVWGDTWHSTFAVYDAHNVRLFVLGEWDSPSMNVGNRPGVAWSYQFKFPAAEYEAIASITPYYAC